MFYSGPLLNFKDNHLFVVFYILQQKRADWGIKSWYLDHFHFLFSLNWKPTFLWSTVYIVKYISLLNQQSFEQTILQTASKSRLVKYIWSLMMVPTFCGVFNHVDPNPKIYNRQFYSLSAKEIKPGVNHKINNKIKYCLISWLGMIIH